MSKSRDVFRSNESWERWNTHQTTMVEQEVFGTILRFVQDPSSEHLGTTVWDASVVLAKWFEKNIRKGDFSRAKVRGKRAIELGAGMGLAGMAFAMVGADVVLTDTADVLGLLRINYDNNLSPAAVRLARAHQHGTWADSAGSVAVAELDWTKPEQCHMPPLKPPYDFVLAADCIYHEVLTEHFHRTVMDVTNEKSTVVVCNELRSHSVQGRFMELFSATHSIKAVPHSKMDDTYQHANIFIYIMKKKKHLGAPAAGGVSGPPAGAGAADADAEAEPGEEVGAGASEVGAGKVEDAAAEGKPAASVAAAVKGNGGAGHEQARESEQEANGNQQQQRQQQQEELRQQQQQEQQAARLQHSVSGDPGPPSVGQVVSEPEAADTAASGQPAEPVPGGLIRGGEPGGSCREPGPGASPGSGTHLATK